MKAEDFKPFQSTWIQRLGQRGPYQWDSKNLALFLRGATGCGRAKICDGQLVAFVLYYTFSNLIDICYLETPMEFRRQGHMQELLSDMIESHPGFEIWLDVHQGNKAARCLYENLGFEQTGVRKAYYADGGDGLGFHFLSP